MSTLNFYLKSVKPDKNGKVPIIAQIAFDSSRKRKSLPIKIKPSWWNKNKQVVYSTKFGDEKEDRDKINDFLHDYKENARDFLKKCILFNIEISDNSVSDFFSGKEIKKRNISYKEAFDQYVASAKIEKAKQTYSSYLTVQKFLNDFQDEEQYVINFDNINLQLFDKLKHYAFLNRKINNNYFAKIIRVFKSFLNWSADRNYYNGTEHKKFKAKETEKEIIFLTIEELEELRNENFENETYNICRDIYCFSCFTALRISDIKQLKKKHIVTKKIKGEDYLFINKTVQKTSDHKLIPLNKYAIEILNKYEDVEILALPKMSSATVNESIKECCKLIGIDEPITISIYTGGIRTEITKPKHELITIHTARKTFITNSMIKGMHTEAIKGISGHTDDRSFRKYKKITEDFILSQMNSTWND